MADALHKRINPAAADVGCSIEYRSMSLIELAREFLTMHGINARSQSRSEIAVLALNTRTGSMMTTGDFPSLLANVASKRMRQAYDENPGTYGLWARRAADAPDFKEITSVQISSAPDLLQTNEAGEFQYGTLSDRGEKYQIITYGRILSLSRQAMINDDLRGFDRMIQSFAIAARRLENRLVYAQLTSNAALSDGVDLFHAGHGNLATVGALAISSLAAARAAMRLQKGLQTEELNVSPAFLIVPAALEQTAYTLTSSNYVPATKAEINEFRTGGKTSLQPVVEPLLDAGSSTAWYLAANANQVDTVEYCYLSGADGPTVESEASFSSDGIAIRCRHDFATKAIDYRGLYKSEGA